MPVKPPEPYAEVMVQKLHKLLDGADHEILLQTEDGISNAVWHGVEKAEGEIVAVLDGDGSHDPCFLPEMLSILSPQTDLVCASRRWNGYPLHRKIISLFSAWLTRRALGLNLRDPLTAYIVGKREVMRFDNTEGCKFVLEILANVPNERVAEYPVCFKPLEEHKSKLSPVEFFLLLKQLWRLRNGKNH